jgi:hypothetical protein
MIKHNFYEETGPDNKQIDSEIHKLEIEKESLKKQNPKNERRIGQISTEIKRLKKSKN